MSTITTLRPSSTSSAVGWSVVPSGTADEVTSDNSDATYALWSGAGAALVLDTPADAPPTGEKRHVARLRVRGEDGSAWWAVRLGTGGLIAGASGDFGATDETISGSWGTGLPADGTVSLAAYVVGQTTNLQVTEVYLDVDSREPPSFTAQVIDGSGAVTATIADTNAPSIRANAPAADGLALREYRYWVTSGATVVWDTGVLAGAPTTRQTTPLANGSYTAHLQIWSTLGANTAYASDEETVAFTVAVGTVPTPDAPTVGVVSGAPALFAVSACAGDMTGFDGDVGYIEVRRLDCVGTEAETPVTVALLGPLATDGCGQHIDYSAPRSGMGASCDHEPAACCFGYEARSVGLVDGALLVSDWVAQAGGPQCLDTTDIDSGLHLLRTVVDGVPMQVTLGGAFSWTVTRPYAAGMGVMGTRMVTTADVGGRNLSLSVAVDGEQEWQDLHTVLSRPLVLVSPADSAQVWSVPVAESMRVVKVDRIRQVTMGFTATGPQPAPAATDIL